MRFFILGHTLGPPVEWQAMLHGQGRMLRGVRVRGLGMGWSEALFHSQGTLRGAPGGSVPAARFAWGAHAAPRASSGTVAGGMRRIRVTHDIGTDFARPDCRPSREGARRDTRGRVWSPCSGVSGCVGCGWVGARRFFILRARSRTARRSVPAWSSAKRGNASWKVGGISVWFHWRGRMNSALRGGCFIFRAREWTG